MDTTIPVPVAQEAASSVTANDIPVTNTPPPEDDAPPPVTTGNAVASAPPIPMQAPPASSSISNGQYRDGQYVGSSADAYYGNVQVEVTIQHGQIANVQFLDYPRDRSTSYYINSQAMPELHTEAIQVQTAPVDGVSGATYTSQAFNQSLASALSQAKTHA